MITEEMVKNLIDSDPLLKDFLNNTIPEEDIKRREIICGISLIPTEQMICLGCGKSVIGDPKYHQVYSFGSLQGYRHRKCRVNYCKYGSILRYGDKCEDTYMGCMHRKI